jgi:hypothetical protein
MLQGKEDHIDKDQNTDTKHAAKAEEKTEEVAA